MKAKRHSLASVFVHLRCAVINRCLDIGGFIQACSTLRNVLNVFGSLPLSCKSVVINCFVHFAGNLKSQ